VIEHLGQMTPDQWAELEDGEIDPFGGWDGIEWAPKEHNVVLRGLGGRLIASVGLTVIDVEAGGERFPAVGVGAVIVSHAHRRQGHLRPTLDAALERAATLGPERAMLFCSPANAGMYGSFGFVEIAAPVHAHQPGGELEMPPLAMWRPLRAGVTWPEGAVRLPGLPF